MKNKLLMHLLLGAFALTMVTVQARDMQVNSDTTVGGFLFPESAGCDAAGKAVYVSQFVSALKPADKDGKGRISKVGLDGTMIDPQFLPGPGDVLNKPKGIWVEGERLWVSDIDVVWVFDLKTRKGRKLDLPGAQFANDVAVQGNTLYVSDNRLDAVFMIQPADFLATPQTPKVTQVASAASTNPNGIYPAQDGSLLLAGVGETDHPRGLYALGADGKVTTLADNLGKLDGLYQAPDGSLLVTDWVSGTLFSWTRAKGRQTLATDFKGPADFCAMPSSDGLNLVVPDLIKGELRLIKLH
jgi:hypothetical protein